MESVIYRSGEGRGPKSRSETKWEAQGVRCLWFCLQVTSEFLMLWTSVLCGIWLTTQYSWAALTEAGEARPKGPSRNFGV